MKAHWVETTLVWPISGHIKQLSFTVLLHLQREYVNGHIMHSMHDGTVPFSLMYVMLTLCKLPGPVLHFHTASIGKLGRVCEQCSITIAQLGSNVHVVLVACVRWIIPSNILTTGKGRKRHMHATKPPVKKFCTRQIQGLCRVGPRPYQLTIHCILNLLNLATY